ncbi:hypothetical protein BASA50_005081 [Batrachochytrium salamandrivorans]|uniref:Nucleolar protein 9 n=1 Tax=Batrachochytrium salamandrivorans TaxID=1357716 RepID=A0ABQ8FEQ0_9FUNG|nr:hypothetical protein BASA62_003352 [Batrachochytrium salamandrivorans]KAH6584943.1 hypothetical protein BASA61_007164 [Batrachochytrium salamandrivorans]KAH6596376.1 hypothetical protein BASA50_005081 [Batrachochytrium salamandrivorans]KAH9275639.1 hypothetical protein BASA83_001928 [Batrachochytrium salamandrivorans]KAJ1330695.1 hypothetical protein BSLG_009147 [Batrachochytrium salamandrivorans]
MADVQTAQPQATNKNKRGRRGGKKQHELHPEAYAAAAAVTAAATGIHTKNDLHNDSHSHEEAFSFLGITIDTRGTMDAHTSHHSDSIGAGDDTINDAGGDDMDNRPRKKTRRSKRGKTANFLEADDEEANFLSSSLHAASDIKWTAASTNGPSSYSAEHSNSLENGSAENIDAFAIDPVDTDLRQYFENIERLLEEQEFETPEDMQLFVSNVYNEIQGRELIVSGDYATSRILEKLLRGSNDVQIRMFTTCLVGHAHRLFTHQFASHVFQTLFTIFANVVDREVKGETASTAIVDPDEPLDEEEAAKIAALPSMESLLLSLCAELHEVWSSLLLDPYGSHVVRTLLNVLSGQPLVDEQQLRSKKSNNYNKNHNNFSLARKPGLKLLVPQSFGVLLTSIVESLTVNLKDTDLYEMAKHPIANPVLQILLQIPDSGDTLVSAFLRDGEFFSSLLEHQVGSHLAEKLISKASPKLFKKLYTEHIRPRFLILCNHHFANFVIQRVMDKMHTEVQFEDALDIIEPHISRMLFQNRTGIILKAVEAAIRFPRLQPRIMTALYKAFEVFEDDTKMKDLATLILHLSTYDRFQQFVRLPNVQGALMLQHICQYSPVAAKACLDSLLSVNSEDMQKWIADPISSRVLEALLSSTAASIKTKRRLIRMFFGRFVDLATDKYGSHFVDKCWAVASLDARRTIADELAERLPTLANNFHAKFILRNCKLDMFKQNRSEWVDQQRIELQRRDRLAETAAAAAAAVESSDHAIVTETEVSAHSKDKKKIKVKKAKQTDEIDDLFAKKLK